MVYVYFVPQMARSTAGRGIAAMCLLILMVACCGMLGVMVIQATEQGSSSAEAEAAGDGLCEAPVATVVATPRVGTTEEGGGLFGCFSLEDLLKIFSDSECLCCCCRCRCFYCGVGDEGVTRSGCHELTAVLCCCNPT